MNSDFSRYRVNDINYKLCRIGARPLDIMVTGVTGAGKSTTLNSFFQTSVADVGNGVDPKTIQTNRYFLNESLRLWDTPGLGDSKEADLKYKEKLIDLLNKTYGENYGYIDMVLIVIEGCKRDMGTTYTLLNEVIAPNIQGERILVAINQADFAMKGRFWDYSTNTPQAALESFLKEQAYSIQRRVKEATGVLIKTPVFYSAKYQYHISELFDFIIDNMPTKPRPMNL